VRFPSTRNLGPVAAAYARASLSPASSPWDTAPWCVVDLELSGLDPRRHEIVAFAAIPVEHGRIQLAGAVSGLIRPAGALTEASIRIHGLRTDDLADAPPLGQAIEPLLAAMTGRSLVAHVARIEHAFLRRALREQGLRLRGPIVDTSVIGRLWLAERDGTAPADPRLADLARQLGLPVHAEHSALGDALTTAQVFITAATHLGALGVETVRSLARAGRRLDAALAYPAERR
jgi:DNA polymerase-3 subunit epsilon